MQVVAIGGAGVRRFVWTRESQQVKNLLAQTKTFSLLSQNLISAATTTDPTSPPSSAAVTSSVKKRMAEEAVLGYLEHNELIKDSGEFAVEKGISHDEIVNVIKSLNGYKYVIAKDIKKEKWQLTAEGQAYAANGSPEFQLFTAIPPEGISKADLQLKSVKCLIYGRNSTQS
ncbi:Aminoacyl-tRNA synthetase, class II [Artemisia annua]|uniref:Aminoacyl-tRNA synthetase, class II n=1 Tax=Artemisia annua TaxID=35608 RepID=A0A2U1LPG8_ARTAN|nr:Aminoacyl-tRNA synthetase, class II [Artemisia annua]